MPDETALHVYETRIGKLCVGVPHGQARPALWAVGDNGQPVTLGRLNGPLETEALVKLLDAAFDDINRVITHYKRINGDFS